MKFEWDEKKAASNYRRHNISFTEAGTVFSDPLAEFYYDPDHSSDETRLIVVGYSNRRTLIFVSFVEKGDNTIRIISARHVTRSERLEYEEKEK